METGEQVTLAAPAAWLSEQADESDLVEVTLTDASKHYLLLPAHVSAQKAVGILIGTQEQDGPSWPPVEWIETHSAIWIRRSAVVSLQIVRKSRTATA